MTRDFDRLSIATHRDRNLRPVRELKLPFRTLDSDNASVDCDFYAIQDSDWFLTDS